MVICQTIRIVNKLLFGSENLAGEEFIDLDKLEQNYFSANQHIG